jgi:DNA-binding CsgD family transcriptional regulator/tetratricopeptide (TPR) repeat protein
MTSHEAPTAGIEPRGAPVRNPLPVRRGGTSIWRPSGDTSIVARRLTSNRFVGRSSELTELEQGFAEASAGRPVLVLLGGDSGVGKTRLIAELEQELDQRDMLVLRGEAVEQDDGELPYVGLTSALRPLVRRHDPAIDELTSGSRDQLAALLPGLEGRDGRGDGHGPSAQLRLFEALVELLDVLSERQPLALILEDMHWADRSTRTFASFLARSLRQERVMVVLTFRSDELHRRHPLRPLLSELERLDHVRRIQLQPLDRAEMHELLTDILDAPPEGMLVERLYRRSEGNPLYTEELLAAGLDGRGSAPESLRDAFMLRIERLSQPAQRAARAIAVGRRLDEDAIAEITGIDRDSLQVALREAVAEHVLITDEEGRFQFRHALLREVLYDDLLPGERGELHLKLARLLEARMSGGQEQEAELAAAVAGHYAAAGDQPAALRAAVQAALAARAVHAYGEAAELAERSIELWPRVADASALIPLTLVDLLTVAASSHTVVGDLGRAEVLVERALDQVDPEAEPQLYAGLLDRLARLQWSLNRGVEGVETAQRALSMLPQGKASQERALLMAWLARTRVLRGRFRDAVPDGDAALAAAIEVGDRHAEGEVLNTLGMAHVGLGSVDHGVALLRQAIALAREENDLDNLGYGYSNLADMLNLAGRTAEALETARAGLDAVPRRMTRMHDWLTLTVAQLAFEAGDWELMRAHLDTRAAPLDRPRIFALVLEAEIALADGELERAAQLLEAGEPLVAASTEAQWIGWFGALQAELFRRRYELECAREAVEHALGRLEVCTDDVMRIARVSAIGSGVEADIARRAHDLRERAEEREAMTRLRLHLSRLDAAAEEGGPVERAWQAVGKAQLARARARNNPSPWAAAADRWDAIERPYAAAIIRWRQAEAAVESEDRAAAVDAACAAVETARRLGARWLQAEVEALAQRARLQLADGDTAAEQAEADGGDAEEPFGLTPRERQVLALIAEGATNRQIGAALFMAEKTASVHVSRILGKLGVQSRTQAAAVAHRQHLV